MFHKCTKSFGAKMHHFLTIPLLSSFLPVSNLLLLFSRSFAAKSHLVGNLLLLFSRSFAAKSHLVPVVTLLSLFLPLGCLLLIFLCNYFFFNFYFLFLLLNHTKSPSSQTPKKPFNILQQVSSNFKTKNTKTSFFY